MIEDAMDGTIRVRFAPSPNGPLHLGNARTALFNWLFARHTGGKFILRVEDTEMDRAKTNFEKQLIDDLVWLGLTWDEGPNESGPGETGEFGPYRQSKRLEIYLNHTIQLLADGKAYRCFCTQEELEAERQQAIARQKPQIYSGRCRNLPKSEIKENLVRGKSYSVRLKLPDHPIRFHDVARGDLEFAPASIGDPILVHSAQGGAGAARPGVPVDNYVVAVDDALMGITHVIRGDDHIANTSRQVAIFEAFEWKVPQYVHLPTILGPDGERLSKRHGATTMANFREMGYMPEALVNHLVLLGWSAEDGTSETFEPDELVRAFSLERVARDPVICDFEKLHDLNRHYMKQAAPSRLTSLCWEYFGGYLPDKEQASDKVLVWFSLMISMYAPSVNRLDEIPAKAAFIFHVDPNLVRENQENAAVLESPTASVVLNELATLVRAHDGPVTAQDLTGWMKGVKESTGVRGNALDYPVRIALTGTTSEQDLDKLIPLIEQGAALNIGILSVRQRLEEFLGV
jgi:glutamyl-tRNA synthetase/nondiscriminating glutamyl-tRNA synthetase